MEALIYCFFNLFNNLAILYIIYEPKVSITIYEIKNIGYGTKLYIISNIGNVDSKYGLI